MNSFEGSYPTSGTVKPLISLSIMRKSLMGRMSQNGVGFLGVLKIRFLVLGVLKMMDTVAHPCLWQINTSTHKYRKYIYASV